MKIDTELKKIRVQKKITQSKIAKESNISIMSYQRYETGERIPNVHTAQLIAKVLGIENVKDIFPLPQENDNTEKGN